jgi:hypothetical protein
MQGYLWIIWIKLAGVLWIIGGKIRQLINILFCDYRRLEIGDCRSKNAAETYTRLGTVPQRVIKRRMGDYYSSMIRGYLATRSLK